ncbi:MULTISPECIES: hypothetical protein [Shewanella]|jgi:hypothetical protein|uniref:Lipoprotein n=1 Tax=Shewanella psychromarinicola TaxID=2487742 RepID=A0A3N4ED30_9GAMM|nr:hypothetical protein [Shewanella psychromarinicola]AZG37103.1 hypothetical protein EGC80_21010 [Shewanella psychromarinicola]MCL1083008.1 hypothetical protein [Shewanella psychromarinicola]RPA34958.1 hypothetical protein EGC77_04685 [Shewanella psychromarinicola]
MQFFSSWRVLVVAVAALALNGCASSPDEMVQCGTVSSYLAPDNSANLYRVVVTHLDDVAVISRPNYLLSPGEHKFTVAELINSPELKVLLSARKVKVFTVNVAADQRYHIGAKFNTDKIYIGQNSLYWQPVVWQTESHQCEMKR